MEQLVVSVSHFFNYGLFFFSSFSNVALALSLEDELVGNVFPDMNEAIR